MAGLAQMAWTTRAACLRDSGSTAHVSRTYRHRRPPMAQVRLLWSLAESLPKAQERRAPYLHDCPPTSFREPVLVWRGVPEPREALGRPYARGLVIAGNLWNARFPA